MTLSSGYPIWFSALEPYVEQADLRVQLEKPFTLPSGEVLESIAGVFMRFPKRSGSPFVDDFGKKSAAMIELHGEHLFAELAVLRLLEKAGWHGRWVNTYSGRGEVWKFLTEWKDVPRRDQVSRFIREDKPRDLLSRIAAANGTKRYTGCWDTFAWRGSDYVFLESKRQTPKYKDVVKEEQEDWLRAALLRIDAPLSLNSFGFVQWDYQADT